MKIYSRNIEFNKHSYKDADLDKTFYNKKNNVTNQTSRVQSNHVSFQGGLYNATQKLAGTKLILDVGQMAANRAGMFEAVFAIFLTCVLRPITIVATPDGSDKRDKQYAAAQSISSGTVGLVTSKILLDPFSKAGENLSHKINVNRINQLHSQGDGQVFNDLCKNLGLDQKTFGEGITALNKHVEDSTKLLESNLIELKKYKLAIIDNKTIKQNALSKEQLDAANEFIKNLQMDNQTVDMVMSNNIKQMTKEQKTLALKAVDVKIKAEEKNIRKVVNNILGIADQKVDLGIKAGKDNAKLIVKLDELDIAKAIKSLALQYEGDKQSTFRFIKEVKDANFLDVLKGTKINDNVKYLMKNKYFEPFKFLGWSYGTKFLITPILAILTIGAVTPIVKKLFPKKSKTEPVKSFSGASNESVTTKQYINYVMSQQHNSQMGRKFEGFLNKRSVN